MTTEKKNREPNIHRRPYVVLLLIAGWFTGGFRLIDRYMSQELEGFVLALFVISTCFPVWIVVMTVRLRSVLHEKGYKWIRLRDAYILFINLNRRRSYIPDRETFLCIPGAREHDLASMIEIAQHLGTSDSNGGSA
jgi:hypothetical protein